ncbi:MAG: NusG domain II-containing protein [Lachnospiraceae bacterium]|nr:NusG domain II-containing protein [Lachnospiraceae bacterium]
MRELKPDNKQQSVIRSMTRADIILIAGCLFVVVFLSIFFIVCRRAGSMITISYDGIELYRMSLEELSLDNQTQYYLIKYEDEGRDIHIMHYEQYPELPVEQSYNLFAVTGRNVTMEAANCRDQICVRHIPIKNDRESIICLPNKLVIEIRGSAELSMPQTGGQNRDGTPEDESDEPLDGVVG